MSIQTVLIIADLLAIAAYGPVKRRMKPRTFRVGSLVTLAVWLVAILYITILSRQPVLETRWNIIPQLNQGLNVYYIQTLPNFLIFVPVGLLLVTVLPRRKSVEVILIGCGISLGIELVQLFVHVGICDIDDLITNSLGCIVGVLSTRIWKISRKDRA